MAGPDSPAVTLAMRGLRVSGSMAMATNVFTSEMASAPASWATRAISAMLVTLGESFTISGRRDIRLAVFTTSSKRPRIAAKLYAAGDCIGTRYVQFVGGNVLAFVQDLNGALVLFAAVAEHVGEDHDIFHLAQLGQLLIDKGARADILQSNRIEHPGRGFIKTRRRIARHGLGRKSLHHKAAQFVEVDHILELNAIAERPAGGDDWILQLDAGNS